MLTDLWPLKRQLDATRPMLDSARFQFLERPVKIDDESLAVEASELVARGWAHLRSGSFFELSDAVSAFSAATEVAPAYAAAHAGLALTKVAQATLTTCRTSKRSPSQDHRCVHLPWMIRARTHRSRWDR